MYKYQWLNIYKDLKNKGKNVNSRGYEVLELEDYSFKANPYYRFANFKERELSIKYIIGEFTWYLGGDLNDVERITHYSSFWNKLLNDKEPYLYSNYGYYIFKQKQFDYVLDILKRDKHTRQASIIICNKDVMSTATKDKICTYSINFRIRDNKLNMSVNMRSNDFVFGTQIDFFQFTVVQEMLLKKLQNYYPKLKMGYYYHKADSFHIYKKHWDIMNKIINNNGKNFEKIYMPKIYDSKEVNFLIEELPKIELQIRENNYNIDSFIIDKNFKFTKECIKYLSK